MLTLDQIRGLLADRRLNVVSEKTGIHVGTISNIRDGKTQNPTYYVLSRLSDYLESTPRNG